MKTFADRQEIDRVFFLHGAVEMLQERGYLDDQTLQSLSKDEYRLVLERATAGVN